MAKTDFSQDQNKKYDPLEIVLIRKPGFAAWFSRLFSGNYYNDLAIVYRDNAGLHLVQVVDGKAQTTFSLPKWTGLLSANKVEGKVVSIPTMDSRAQEKLAHCFKSSYDNTIDLVRWVYSKEKVYVKALLKKK